MNITSKLREHRQTLKPISPIVNLSVGLTEIGYNCVITRLIDNKYTTIQFFEPLSANVLSKLDAITNMDDEVFALVAKLSADLAIES
jgi:hypothetical protein